MTGPELRALLLDLGLTGPRFAQVLAALSGRPIAESTIWRQLKDDAQVQPAIAAAAELLARLRKVADVAGVHLDHLRERDASVPMAVTRHGEILATVLDEAWTGLDDVPRLGGEQTGEGRNDA